MAGLMAYMLSQIQHSKQVNSAIKVAAIVLVLAFATITQAALAVGGLMMIGYAKTLKATK